MADYIVTAACVVAKTSNPEAPEAYFYRHAVLPEAVPAEEKDRLVEAGLVSKGDDEAKSKPESKPAAPKG